MKVPLGWLSEWIDLPASADDLAERLTLGGLEIEGIERSGPDLSGVRVGHVLERSPHPDADRLSLCRVDLGDGEPVEIVCGAPNVAAGQKVAVASPGGTLPDGTKLKKTKIRGVVSHGMICSTRELGLGEEHDGILVLDPAAPPGAPLGEVIRAGETVLDLEITPNRGDWASLLGIAREVRAHFGGTLRMPEVTPQESGPPAADDVQIGIDDREGCYRYVGRVVRGITVGPSPDWLVARLESAGMRSINVVVDVTNLILLEFGQPLHAFDLSTLRGRQVVVRSAKEGEKIVTLDGQMRELDPGDLLIADAERPIAIAGVMGGAETEVRDDTTDVLIESAVFDPSRVRRTARRLGLHSEASFRFERGVDFAGVPRAADRCARLLAELAGGEVSSGRVEALGAPFAHCDEASLEPERANRLLGTNLSVEEMATLLGRVEIRAALGSDGRLRCAIPSYRNDVSLSQDLIEEIARIHGYDRIETTMPSARLAPVHRPSRARTADRARDSLAGSGLLETRSWPGIRAADLDALRVPQGDPLRRTVRLLNPVTEEEPDLCTTLLAPLLRAAQRNLSRQIDSVRLFEVGRVFAEREPGELPEEREMVAGLLTRGERQSLWEPSDPPALFFEAKGIVERLIADLGQRARFQASAAAPWLHPGASGDFSIDRNPLARVGELHPQVAAACGISVPCAVFELDLETLDSLPARPVKLRDVSAFPAVRRDIAVVVAQERPAGEILDEIRKTGGNHLAAVGLFDRYEGRGIPEGKVSLAFRMVFQSADRTLTDAEVTRTTERIVAMLASRFDGEQR